MEEIVKREHFRESLLIIGGLALLGGIMLFLAAFPVVGR